MANPGLSKEERRRTLAAYRKHGGRLSKAASELGLSRTTYQSRIDNLRAAGVKLPTITVDVRSAPGGMARKLAETERRASAAESQVEALQADVKRLRAARLQPVPKPKVRRAEREDRVIVIWPDMHGAKQDRAAVAAFLGDLKRLQPSRGVSLGDMADCGGFLGAHHVLGFVAEAADTYEEDTEAVNKFLDAVQGVSPFEDGLDWVEGNHEHRVEKWAITSALRNGQDAAFLRDRFAPEVLCKAKARGIRYYRRAEFYDGMPVQGAFRIGKLGIMHGLLNGNGAPDQVLNKFGMNMVYGHTHRIASKVRRTSDGQIGAWNIGTLARLQQHYAHGAPTDHAHGYAVVFMARSGAFQLIQVSIVNGVSLLPELKI